MSLDEMRAAVFQRLRDISRTETRKLVPKPPVPGAISVMRRRKIGTAKTEEEEEEGEDEEEATKTMPNNVERINGLGGRVERPPPDPPLLCPGCRKMPLLLVWDATVTPAVWRARCVARRSLEDLRVRQASIADSAELTDAQKVGAYSRVGWPCSWKLVF